MDLLGPALAAARAVHMLATLSVAGALAFRLLVAPLSSPSLALSRVLRPSLVLALLGGLAWLVVQAAAMAGAGTVAETLSAVAPVATDTRFGHVLMLRLGLLVLVGLLGWRGQHQQPTARWRLVVAGLLAGVAVVLQAALGHAAAADDPVLEAALALHLLAAAMWLGGLLPLWLALGGPDGAAAARRFSLLGVLAVAAIAATAAEQAAALIGGLAGLVGTAYGRVALVKLALFLGLLGLAAVNRLVFTPTLEHQTLEQSAVAARRLRASVLAEVVLGAMVIVAAASLASLPPGAHDQPVWPFPLRPSLDALQDPDLGAEVRQGLMMLAGGLGLIALGCIRPRRLWPAIPVGAALAWFALPHLDLLLVPAYPTSFYSSPTGFDAAGIAEGRRLFAANCTGCHGASGRGDGPLAAGLDIPPADLTAGHLWEHPDGELFWWLTHGIDSPRGGLSMPGFAATLDEDQRWALIDFIRAHNAGVGMGASGAWPHVLPAPGLEADCGGGRVLALSDLRGQVVRIVVGPPAPSPLLPTIFLDSGPPAGGACVAAAPEIRDAYAVVAGVPLAALGGMSFLVDGNGWLRERRPADAPPLTATALAASIQHFAAQPLAPAMAGHHH